VAEKLFTDKNNSFTASGFPLRPPLMKGASFATMSFTASLRAIVREKPRPIEQPRT